MITLREFIEKNQYITEGKDAEKLLKNPNLLPDVYFRSKTSGVRINDVTGIEFMLKASTKPESTDEQIYAVIKIAGTTGIPFKENKKSISYDGGVTATLIPSITSLKL